ncbi:MAG: peptidylprolyl isomerase [Proteobacteria bacterium]|nr:peptidylprolyl isomerase [Pseudomonadota bacterium]
MRLEKNRILIIACILLISLGMGACKKKAGGGKNLASYQGGVITQGDLDQEMNKYPPQARSRFETPQGKEEILNRLIEQRLMAKAAQERGLEKDPEFAQRIEDMRQRLLIDALRRKITTGEAQISDPDVEKYYQDNEKQYHTAEMVRVRNLQVKTDAEARKLLQTLRMKKDKFENLITKYSQDEVTKSRGGDTGFFPKGSRDPAFEDAAFKLKKEGEVSGVVKTAQGFHLLQLVEKRPEVIRPLDQVREEIKRRINFDKQREAFTNFMNQEKEKAKVQIIKENL